MLWKDYILMLHNESNEREIAFKNAKTALEGEAIISNSTNFNNTVAENYDATLDAWLASLKKTSDALKFMKANGIDINSEVPPKA